MKINPICEIFPLLEGREFDDLVADIKENGLRLPIWLDKSEQIIDGRNRYRACKQARVEPRFKTYEKKDIAEFVVSMNIHRRHLDESQRSMAMGRLANMTEGRQWENSNSGNSQSKKISVAKAAKMGNVSEWSINQAHKVQQKGTPSLIKAVDQGKLAVSAAAKLVDLAPHEQDRIAKASPDKEKAQIKHAVEELERKKKQQRKEELRKAEKEEKARADINRVVQRVSNRVGGFLDKQDETADQLKEIFEFWDYVTPGRRRELVLALEDKRLLQ